MESMKVPRGYKHAGREARILLRHPLILFVKPRKNEQVQDLLIAIEDSEPPKQRDPRGLKSAPEGARKLARELRNSGASLREIAAKLADKGFLSFSERPYLPGSIKRMLGE